MPTFTTKPLTVETWRAFARLVEAILHNATIEMFERQGFERIRPIGATRWVVRKVLG